MLGSRKVNGVAEVRAEHIDLDQRINPYIWSAAQRTRKNYHSQGFRGIPWNQQVRSKPKCDALD